MDKDIQFDMEEFANGKYGVQCETEREAMDFLKVIKAKGAKWANGSDLESHTNWNRNGKRTYYRMYSGDIASVKFGDVSQIGLLWDPVPKVIKWKDMTDDEYDIKVCTPSELADFILG